MPIRKVVAHSASEGLKRVADEFGGDALILKTIKRNGRFEMFVECDDPEPAQFETEQTQPQPARHLKVQPDKAPAERFDNTLDTPKKPDPEQHIKNQYQQARLKMLSSIAKKADLDVEADAALYGANNIPASRERQKIKSELTVKSLVDSLELTPAIAARVRGYRRIDEVISGLATMVSIGPQIDHGIHAFVGPAGSGKTTNMIKLLVKHVMKFGENSCAVINCDSYRMGAKEQLTRLGELIGVDVLQVGKELSLNQALASVHKRQLVLIDMPGLGFESPELKEQLFQLASSHYEIQRLLVVPANLQYTAMCKARQIFADQKATTCVASRVDETLSMGPLLSFLIQSNIPLRYVADGPQIPEDIVQADAIKIVEKALKLADADVGGQYFEKEFAKAPMSDLTNRERENKSTNQGRSVQSRRAVSAGEYQHDKVADL